jgi:hypothetical protein
VYLLVEKGCDLVPQVGVSCRAQEAEVMEREKICIFMSL